MDPPLLRFENVRDEAGLLQGFTLEVPAGGCTVLLGPAGAGKSAALRLVASHRTPDYGEILLGDRVLARIPAALSGIASVAAPESLPGRQSLAALMAQPLKPLRLTPTLQLARVARALTLVGLDGQEGQRLEQLSPPRQRCAALAQALVGTPELLLLDDPLAGLDRAARRDMALAWRAVFRKLRLTTLWATREAEEALLLADTLAVLQAGRCVQSGAPQAVYEDPENAFVAGLVGENNRLPGTVETLEGEDCQVRLDCGPLVEARHVDAGGPGSRCIVTVRPDQVAVAAMSAAEMGEGALPARLRDAIFLGDHMRVLLEIGEGGTLVASRPVGARLPRPGAEASVAWDPYAAFAFRALR
jgi:ABC-type Fe3+/spermidine/putrescine transport system ATPase subunit